MCAHQPYTRISRLCAYVWPKQLECTCIRARTPAVQHIYLRTAMTRRRRAQQKATEERCDNYSDDAAWDRRHKHRLAGLAAVKRSRDFVSVLSMVASGELLPEDVPVAPNADDRMCCKRQWERSMQQWRGLLKCVLQQSTQD